MILAPDGHDPRDAYCAGHCGRPAAYGHLTDMVWDTPLFELTCGDETCAAVAERER